MKRRSILSSSCLELRRSCRLLFLLCLAGILSVSVLRAAPQPAPVDEYAIHADGGLIFDPLRREAERTGQLARYAAAKTVPGHITQHNWQLDFQVPTQCEAYDAIPISYELKWRGTGEIPATNCPVAVEAVAFENAEARKNRDLFDLALPGHINLRVEYLGSITAHLRPKERNNMKPDCTDPLGKYPSFARGPLVRSGIVESGDLVWFKFRYTNAGDTILDPEGFGGCLLFPELLKRNSGGQWERLANLYNLYCRNLNYMYPGDSAEVWFLFSMAVVGKGAEYYRLEPGDYRIRFQLACRYYQTTDPYLNAWDGPIFFASEHPIRVEAKAEQAPMPQARVVPLDELRANRRTPVPGAGARDHLTRFIHTMEEFMTAFDCHLAPPADKSTVFKGTLYLQVAPWTEQVVVRLVDSRPLSVKTAAIPVHVGSESLAIRFNPATPAWVLRHGRAEPVFLSQLMADMRSNVQLDPFPEQSILTRLRQMQEAGVNVVATTGMYWLYNDQSNPTFNYNGDAWKYFLDLARQEGMRVEGWGACSFDRDTIGPIASWISGKPFKIEPAGADNSGMSSLTDPALPQANAITGLYQSRRWGDLFYYLSNGAVPIGVEDTRGFMRNDVNNRMPMGERTIQAFRGWVRDKYHDDIAAVNAAWHSKFQNFEQIQPEKSQVRNQFGHKWEYTQPAHYFHDWNDAVADLDTFRTELRVKNYREMLEAVRKEIPTATVCLRTEGGNIFVDGLSPEDSNPHIRHAYFSQRRCAAIADIIQKSGLITLHSDYTTLPYTPSELRKLVAMSVKQGIIPAYLPCVCDMREIAINQRYGVDYQVHYNLPKPAKGYLMHTLMAAYPWFKIMHEEGGIPGIEWEDYQCDGFVTETQRRELRLFKANLEKAMSSPEAAAVRNKQTEIESQRASLVPKSIAKRSYSDLPSD